jgi:hypothetical protein
MAEGLTLNGIETNLRHATEMDDQELMQYLATLKAHIPTLDYSPERQAHATQVFNRATFELASRFMDNEVNLTQTPETRAGRVGVMMADFSRQILGEPIFDDMASVS